VNRGSRLAPLLAGAARALLLPAGWILGPVGLAFEELATLLLGGGRPMEDWDLARRVLADLFPDLDLERVRVRHRARLAIPARYRAITLGSGIYARPALSAASLADLELLLHELAHVRQYRRLGWLGFACAYGAGVATSGYRASPLETEARDFVSRHGTELRERLESLLGPVPR
jgi:hypothetical protein